LGEYFQLVISIPTKSDILTIYLQEWNLNYLSAGMELILYDKKSRAIANILPAQFLIFYETHFNAKN